METNGAASARVEEDLPFQVRSWRVQRLGWCVFALYVGAALAGFLGDGPLAQRRVEMRGYSLAYRSPWMNGRDSRVLVEIKEFQIGAVDRPRSEPRRIAIRGDLASLRNLHFVPGPISSVSRKGSVTASFEPETTLVSVEAVAGSPGPAKFWIDVNGEQASIALWILP